MLLESLTLSDFGLFRGNHVIDLNPKKKYGSTKPIVLFGGLNGSGKTTILTAIRLAIYGRQALGYGISQRAYDEYLRSKVHRNRTSAHAASRAGVAIEFLYYKLGKPTKYQVSRSWEVSEKNVSETLTILQDDQPIPEFTSDQCQSFLNELIPLGVSELFFFDGEKIASLADDGGDVALRDAIRKLLGLDIIERLNSDLHIYVRKQNTKLLPEETKAQLESFDQEYRVIKELIASEEAKIGEIQPRINEARAELERLELKLSSKGGNWAVSRQSLKDRRDQIILDKKELEAEAREFLSGLFPLALAPKLMAKLKDQLQKERLLKDWESVASAVNQRLGNLNQVIAEYIPAQKSAEALNKVRGVFADLVSRPEELKSVSLLHDLASKDYIQQESRINDALGQQVALSETLKAKLKRLDVELGNVSLQIERAPDQESLEADIESIKTQNNLIVYLTSQRNVHLELAKRETWQAIEVVRKMKKLEEFRASTASQSSGTDLATQTRDVLTDFANEMTKRKIEKLEREFADAFSRLARKSDAIINAKIDPSTFEVHLYNTNGSVIPKHDLSAGEKQIYAVAMLEALAKTSGRKLPIIIDTPLGRLDSFHREKLINNYFPHASHQVIILSTDTEVDESFYDDLAKHVSHSYHINYDENKGASEVKEGYFWKSSIAYGGGLAHASK